MDRSFPTGHNFHAASDLLGEEKPGKLLPKHKAIIMYFMYGADVARLSHASHGAANFMWKAYGLEIRGTTIEGYYTQTRKNAKDAGVKWDQDAVAHIIRSLVKDQDTFYETATVCTETWSAYQTPTVCNCTADQTVTVCDGTKWLLKEALDACNAAHFPSYEASENQAKPKIREPDLKQACEETWTIEQEDIRKDCERQNKRGAEAIWSSPPGIWL